MNKLKPCPFCGKEIDTNKDMHIPERDWKPSFYDPDSGGYPISIHCECGLGFCPAHRIIKNSLKHGIKE